MYLSKRNAWVVLYTQYIVNVKQDVLVVLKSVGFDRRSVTYIMVRFGRQEPNAI